MVILTVSAEARTDFSKTIQYVQEKYANQFEEYPILIFDKDELSYRYLQKNAFGKSKEKEVERANIIVEYVKEKTGVEITMPEAMGYEPYTTVLKGSAVALPVLGRTSKDKANYVMCAVFPASPNSNQKLETHRILQLDTPDSYENVNFEGLQEKFTYEEMKMFSLYHELGHCMDRTFMPEMYLTYEATPHDVHLGESFAEVFGLLLLEMEGYKNLGLKRALYRNLYSTVMGKWFVDNPQNGFGNPLYKSGGPIYYLVPSILEARKRLEKRKNPLVVTSLEDIKIAAKDIVETAAYSSRSFSAVNYWFFEGQEKALDMYQEYHIKMPELFDGVLGELSEFIFQHEYLYEKLAGFEESKNSVMMELPTLGLADFCIAKNDKEELFKLIQSERTQLLSWVGPYEDQLERKDSLDSLFEDLQECGNAVMF
jgi:hypothetical protein